jgi:hypothetical protein
MPCFPQPPSRPSGEGEEEPVEEEEEAVNTDFAKPNLMVEGRELQRFGIGLSRDDVCHAIPAFHDDMCI